jgi:hypothetical protein
MPIDIADYPVNWRDIARLNKELHFYTCQFCLKGRIKHNCFTTHHIDWDTQNNVQTNLACLHASCHLLFHSRYRSCRDPISFADICRAYQSQTNFQFVREFEDNETSGKFIRYKIAERDRGLKWLRSFSPKSC